MLNLLADECVDVQLVYRLRRLGYVVKTVRGYCRSKYGDGITDESVLEIARRYRLAVLTTNVSDFELLDKKHRWHFGIILIENENDVRTQTRRIDDAIRRERSLKGRLVRVTAGRTNSGSRPRQRRKRNREG